MLHCYVLISLLEINFKLDTGRNNSDEQYNAMLVLRVINYMMTINDEFDLIDVINGKILFMHCMIAIMYSLEYGMQYYLLIMKIQNMLPHITIKLSVIRTISYPYKFTVYYNNDKSDASGRGDDSDANTDELADAGIVLSPHGMELWLDESDEATMITQINQSTSTDQRLIIQTNDILFVKIFQILNHNQNYT